MDQLQDLHHNEPYQGIDVSVCLDDISKHGFHWTAAHKRLTHLALECMQMVNIPPAELLATPASKELRMFGLAK